MTNKVTIIVPTHCYVCNKDIYDKKIKKFNSYLIDYEKLIHICSKDCEKIFFKSYKGKTTTIC